MSTKAVTAHLTTEEHDAFSQEAQGFGLSPSAYSTQLIRNRGEKQIELANPDMDRMRSKYEGKIEVLSEQLEKAQQQLLNQTERAGLNGVEAKSQNVKALVDKALDEERKRVRVETLERENEELKAENKELSDTVDRLEKEVEQDVRMSRYVETGGKLLEGIGRMNPAAGERIANGLAGLLGAPSASSGLSEQDQTALKIGQSVMHDFPDRPGDIVDLLMYLRDTPGQLDAIRKGQKFVNWKSTNS